MMHTLPNDMGDVVFANEDRIELSCGITLHLGEQVYLPEMAGGKLGKVDFIAMMFDPQAMKAELVLRIEEVNDPDKGHQFQWPA